MVEENVAATGHAPVRAAVRGVAGAVDAAAAAVGLVELASATDAVVTGARAADAAPALIGARVRVDHAAVEEREVPLRLVQLRVVDIVTGDDHELDWSAAPAAFTAELLHRLLDHERQQTLLRTVGGVERAA